MLISTPLSLFMALASLNGPDDLSIERKFSAVLVQNGMRLEVKGSGPEAFVVEIDGSRLPKELTRWQGPPAGLREAWKEALRPGMYVSRARRGINAPPRQLLLRYVRCLYLF